MGGNVIILKRFRFGYDSQRVFFLVKSIFEWRFHRKVDVTLSKDQYEWAIGPLRIVTTHWVPY